jgi:hypothetical protein
MKQGKYETLIHHRARFESMVNAMEEVNLLIVDPCVLEQVTVRNGRTLATTTAEDREEARQKVLANQFIRAANNGFDAYKRELENGVLNGRDEYPATLANAAEVMDTRVDESPPHISGGDSIAAFVQSGTSNTSGAVVDQVYQSAGNHAHTQCFNCGTMSHSANPCPAQSQQGATMVLAGLAIPKTWILLDNQSTVLHLFNNPELLKNINDADKQLAVTNNGGTTVTRKGGSFPGFGNVWYDPKAITNILSLRLCRIVITSILTVEWPAPSTWTWVKMESPEGLYY